MFKAIFTIIFTYFFAKLMSILFSEEYSGFAKNHKSFTLLNQNRVRSPVLRKKFIKMYKIYILKTISKPLKLKLKAKIV